MYIKKNQKLSTINRHVNGTTWKLSIFFYCWVSQALILLGHRIKKREKGGKKWNNQICSISPCWDFFAHIRNNWTMENRTLYKNGSDLLYRLQSMESAKCVICDVTLNDTCDRNDVITSSLRKTLTHWNHDPFFLLFPVQQKISTFSFYFLLLCSVVSAFLYFQWRLSESVLVHTFKLSTRLTLVWSVHVHCAIFVLQELQNNYRCVVLEKPIHSENTICFAKHILVVFHVPSFILGLYLCDLILLCYHCRITQFQVVGVI